MFLLWDEVSIFSSLLSLSRVVVQSQKETRTDDPRGWLGGIVHVSLLFSLDFFS